MDANEFLKNCQIVLIAGGPGSRLMHRTNGKIPKHLLKIGNKTLVDYAINMYTKFGCRNFVFLLGHLGDKIKEYVQNKYGKTIKSKFMIEKERLGRALALKMAIESNIIDKTKPCIVHYPDDIILDNNFPLKLVEHHLKGLKKGALATLVEVSETEYRYGVPKSDKDGFVVDFEEKPLVKIPATIGVYVFQPEIYRIISSVVDSKRKPVDIEPLLLRELAKRKIMINFSIGNDIWIPVNEEKEFIRAEQILAKE